MRVVLRNKKDGRYFQGGAQWTENVERAFDFKRSERAVRSALGMKLEDVEIVAEVLEERFKVNVRVCSARR